MFTYSPHGIEASGLFAPVEDFLILHVLLYEVIHQELLHLEVLFHGLHQEFWQLYVVSGDFPAKITIRIKVKVISG